MSRVDGMPVYQKLTVDVSSAHYNLWRRIRFHFPLPLRISLKGLRGLVLIVDQHEWVCVDESLNDLPVICWHKFKDDGRDALHLPVTCEQNYYHYAADNIRDRVLELMLQELGKKLSALSGAP